MCNIVPSLYVRPITCLRSTRTKMVCRNVSNTCFWLLLGLCLPAWPAVACPGHAIKCALFVLKIEAWIFYKAHYLLGIIISKAQDVQICVLQPLAGLVDHATPLQAPGHKRIPFLSTTYFNYIGTKNCGEFKLSTMP